jgi:hypothetical protein
MLRILSYDSWSMRRAFQADLAGRDAAWRLEQADDGRAGQRLARPGGHHRQGRLARQRTPHHLLLHAAKGVEAESGVQRSLQRVAQWQVGGRGRGAGHVPGYGRCTAVKEWPAARLWTGQRSRCRARCW